jgi:hypothetical protein
MMDIIINGFYIIDGKAEAANRLTADVTTKPVFTRSGDYTWRIN